MQKNTILYIFLWVSTLSTPLFGQTPEQKNIINDTIVPWQEQILQLVDVEEIGEDAYNELLEELSELTVWSDTLPQSNHRLKQQVILSSSRCLNNRAGFRNQTQELKDVSKAYLGDPWRQSIRYRLHKGEQWQVGVSMEKDPGEAWHGSFPAFDSWHAFLRYQRKTMKPDIHREKKLQIQDAVIGHYRLRMGYGLTMNQSFSLGKQYFSQQVSQRTNRISPFASNAESDYLQGAAIDLRLGSHLSVLPYFSIVQIDGNLSKDQQLTTLYTDGLHRTNTELSHRHTAWQMAMGAHIGWRDSWYDVGAHVLNTQFEYPYIRKQMSHNQNYFRGTSLTQFAADYRIRAFRNVLQGEFAIDDSLGIASLTSLQTKWSDNWQTALIYHYYGNHYRQIHGSSIGENSEMQGEQGLTLNLSGTLSRHWQMQAMTDWFSFGQPQYQTVGTPDDGYEGLLRAIYSLSWINMSLSYRIKSKNEIQRHSIDAIVTLNPSPFVNLKTQIRKRINDNSTVSEGFAIAQSLGYKTKIGKHLILNLDTQAAYFDTDDYNSRIYINEKNILYGFGFPMLYGQGVRYNLTCNLKIDTHWNVDLKYALSNYAKKSSLSSGLQEIQGNTQQDLWLQMRLSF